ncbi:FliA/WhiG family RNA polymerase sigma factor [Salipaludibacillus aurantiacus]|uniref:RNA polymerase sigma factor for flagellar operon FliA n=1 Tax=Salipaludibacillus aurantiacus TaxID=1601833 RepID=A0A1H9QHX7_9BACI|nr:FliA/WhiG family RNA polymerase sigma factor [Salipaludibacillus aurantiacus]SER60054.1 RNA polymerase sigma factor for flagellar operon FliA [Salipaludibacillus aurantiacus]
MPRVKEKKYLQTEWERWVTERAPSAGDYLVEAYLYLVDYHVQRISANLPRSVQADDLRSHGLLGLYDALEKFDPARELKFDTYASFRIRGAIIDGLRQEDWLPRSLRDKSKKIEQAAESLEQKYGRFVSPKEVADETGLKEEEIIHTMNETFFSNVLSIDEPAQETENKETYSSTIVDHRTLTPDQRLGKKADIEELAEVLKTLTRNEQLVITLFYFEEFSLTEIGEALGLSTSRISQIHSKTIFKLQQKLK